MDKQIKNTRLRRPITSTDLYRKKFNVLNFTGEWSAHIGKPEVKGSWIIFGNSTNGKTRYTIKMAKYLGNFGRVYMNSLEEGESHSIRTAWEAEDIDSQKDNVYLLDNEPLETVIRRLKMRNAPDMVFFDSVQFMRGFTIEQYAELLDQFNNKLFIFTSHAQGKDPKGSVADAIYYRSFVKVRVDNYRAFPQSRYGGNLPFDIWPEKAQAFHLQKD